MSKVFNSKAVKAPTYLTTDLHQWMCILCCVQ